MSVCVYIYSYSYRHTLLINFLIAIINKDASIHFQQERLTTSIYTLPFAQPRFSILSSPPPPPSPLSLTCVHSLLFSRSFSLAVTLTLTRELFRIHKTRPCDFQAYPVFDANFKHTTIDTRYTDMLLQFDANTRV